MMQLNSHHISVTIRPRGDAPTHVLHLVYKLEIEKDLLPFYESCLVPRRTSTLATYNTLKHG
jgi:hypothetical protein